MQINLLVSTLVTLALILVTSPTYAENAPWDTRDQYLAAWAGTALLSDWGTTRNMSHRYREGYYEANPLVSGNRHPTTCQVDLHFLIAIPVIYLVADYLSPDDRKSFIATVAVIETVIVANNLHIGLHFDF